MANSELDHRHLFLIGPRGSGKSTVGQLVADILARQFFDLDQWIVAQSGRTIAEIFQADGEPAFRDWETLGLRFLVDHRHSPKVVALGGGACQRPENQALIRQAGFCVWLRSPPTVLLNRLRNDPSNAVLRPALTNLGELAELEHLVNLRQPGYEHCADYTVDTDRELPQTLAKQIAAWWFSVDK
ncbi:MAG TPA: shikimate kinase [Pirellulaceae bacterium]|nr:shikimate kinase [Pirellulaceae bacterium]